MATSKLNLFNGALLLVGERALSSLTENREPRRLLDNAWDDDTVKATLEQGQWKFAMRSVMVDHDPTLDPQFGYRYGFVKPTDWCCTSAVCSDEYFRDPLIQYADEAGVWYSDVDPIYVKYVSNHADYGGNFNLWPPSFAEYVKAYLAEKIVRKMPGGQERVEDLKGVLKRRRLEALNRDAMAGPATFPARGSWASARFGNYYRRRDGGSRGSLIG